MTSSDRFPVLVRSAVKSNLTDWCFQNLSKRALNALTVQASRFSTGTIRSRERNCLVGGPNIRSHELSSPTTVALLGSIGLLDTPCTIMSFLTMTIAYTIWNNN